jgi:hypothetical protein
LVSAILDPPLSAPAHIVTAARLRFQDLPDADAGVHEPRRAADVQQKLHQTRLLAVILPAKAHSAWVLAGWRFNHNQKLRPPSHSQTPFLV